ncbi:hypothetical protein LS684_18595 [Cytobacillus spongiae]|uniref:hypothetical protein n=1 Tax=Cytobacillus spongiae TaxID=2901381 RepID=UPI001F3A7B2D|nr:hypothetical protein [Cytobacillus spongiae]UII55611.1 hypothetical protein LS684_18595 [Cytobacillus spongiae]
MEKHIEVMKMSLELSETIVEGLQHIQKLLNEGKHEQTVFLFEDVLTAYESIGRTTKQVVKDLNQELILARQTEFGKSAELVVTAFEEKNYAKVQEILQFNFVPKFKKLKEELEKAFNPYLVS